MWGLHLGIVILMVYLKNLSSELGLSNLKKPNENFK